MKCSVCNYDNRDDAMFCVNCGTALANAKNKAESIFRALLSILIIFIFSCLGAYAALVFAGIVEDIEGIKWVNVHVGNPAKGLPTVMALLVYNDPATGYPLAVMDATDITAFRTGATAAIASKFLAKQKPNTMGVIGAGRQAYTQIVAHSKIFQFKRIKVYDVSPEAIRQLINSLNHLPLENASLTDVVQSDIVCTVTPARQPIVKKEWLLPGTHINAVGADAAGKQELDPSILKIALVVVDDMVQAVHAGEINVPISQGIYTQQEVYGTLGELVSGKKKGRCDSKQITIFDSTGVAIEDIAVAKLLYERAREIGMGINTDLVDISG
jgi:alanine dehydrogenase